jgi:2-oxoisovalerate dehydrogenase E2 component (dihydrolipoyl transacylase)
MSELKQFKLPDVGEGLTEADIVKWHVQPGDKVTINQIIVDIETAKAVVELPSPYEGVVAALLVPEGETADVGTPIISVDVAPDADAGEPAAVPDAAAKVPDAAAPQQPAMAAAVGGGEQPPVPRGSTSADLVPPPPAEGGAEPGIHGTLRPKTALAAEDTVPAGETPGPAGPEPPASEERQSVLVGYGVKPGSTTRRPRKASALRPAASARPVPASPGPPAPAAPAAPAPAPAPAGAPGTVPGIAVLAKPPVRKLAKDLGVDLSRLSGTGPGGSITRDDVQSAAHDQDAAELPPAPAPPAAAGLAAVAREERIPIRGVRKHMAAAVVGSAFTAPHVTEFLQIDVTETMAATARLRALPEFSEVRVSPLLLVARALLVAVARHPLVNSSWDADAQEIVVRHYVNLGIAAATERGLLVPNIKDAHALSLPGLARALAGLAETARAGKATPADLRDGTITITNVGVFGVDTGTPILTPGEAAILAFGQVRDAPWVHEGQLAVRKVTTLALSFDHRIVDGDLGSAVLRDVGAMLEDPLRMLAWS